MWRRFTFAKATAEKGAKSYSPMPAFSPKASRPPAQQETWSDRFCSLLWNASSMMRMVFMASSGLTASSSRPLIAPATFW
jgi:hypothetical protein